MDQSRALALFVALVVCASPLGALDWTMNPPVQMPVAKGNHAAGVVNGEIVVAGGGILSSFGGLASDTAFRYDPVADRWEEELCLLPEGPRAFPASAAVSVEDPPGSGTFEDRLLIFGGTDIRDWPLQEGITTILAYDPDFGCGGGGGFPGWRTMQAALPRDLALSSRAVVVDGLVYLVGGHDAESFTPTDRVMVYDPEADTLAPFSGNPLPDRRTEGSAAAFGRTIYYFGGYRSTFGVPTSTSLALDLDTGSWSPIASMPRPAAGTAAVAVGPTIYVLGGWNGDDQSFSEVLAYDPATDTWNEDSLLGCREDLGPLLRGRAALTAHRLEVDGRTRIHAVGGVTGMVEELTCHEMTTVALGQDITPPDFTGLVAAFEPVCPDPPSVELSWSPAQETESPPVVYDVHRSREPAFVPDATTLAAADLSDTTWTDADVVCWDDDPRPYFYLVRARDSADPPNEDDNTEHLEVSVLCETPPAPPDVGVNLYVAKESGQVPVPDWSTYPGTAEADGYRLYRRQDDPRDLYADPPYLEPAATSVPDPDPAGSLLFYKVRATIDCLGIESAD